MDRAVAAAREAMPGMQPSFVAFPGNSFSSKSHYAVFMRGETALTSRLLRPALIEAETGKRVRFEPDPALKFDEIRVRSI